jgi:hypothetical protein
MAQELKSVSIPQPGFFGLNTQENGIGLDVSWASEAYNTVISKNGGLESRKGWQPVSPAIGGLPKVVQIHEYLSGTGVSEIHSCTDDNKIWKGTSALTDISPAVAPTGSNWKIVNFNNNSYAFQAGQDPLEYIGSGVYTKISAGSGFLDSTDQVITLLKPNEALAAFGRLWVADASGNKMKVWWSDSLLGRQWNNGASGSIDLRSVLTQGMDTIVALRAWNGNLIIFCTSNILIYSGAAVPSSMSLVENIVGLGCIARDSIQEVGTDIIFLSKSGIRSLGRTIQEKSLPITDLSRNVRDQLRNYVAGADMSKVRSVYSETNAFYLLTVPSASYASWFTFCVDLRRPLDDGSYRVTVWNHLNPAAFCESRDDTLYIGSQGYLSQYLGYLDHTETYQMTYYTTWLDFSIAQEFFTRSSPNYASFTKILKRMDCTVTTNASTTLVLKWYFDFSEAALTTQITTSADVALAEYADAEFGVAEFTSGSQTFNLTSPLFGSGKIMKLGVESSINGAKVEIQRLDILAKLGRMG